MLTYDLTARGERTPIYEYLYLCLRRDILSGALAVGVIVLGWGIVQLGMSIQSHDASQRTQGILCVFGGLLIAFSKEILSAIGVV